MMTYRILLILALAPPMLRAQVLVEHVSASANTSGHITYIDHPDINNKPDLILFTSQEYGVYNRHETGVWYNGTRWTVYNQDRGAMPLNNRINVLAFESSDPRAYVHTTNSGNTFGHITTLDHPLLNGQPDRVILTTQKFGQYNTRPVGVWYAGGTWYLYNEDKAAMPLSTQFNLLVLDEGSHRIGDFEVEAFQHRADAANAYGAHITLIDHPSSNGERDANLFTTQRWVGTYNEHPTGVWYAGARNAWTIYNQNRAALPLGTNFNVFTFRPYEVTDRIFSSDVRKSTSYFDLKTDDHSTYYSVAEDAIHFILTNHRSAVVVACRILNGEGQILTEQTLLPEHGFNFYQLDLTGLPADRYVLESYFPQGELQTLQIDKQP